MEKFDRNVVQAILFDVYGTLFDIGDRRAPYRQLLQLGVRQGRNAGKADAGLLMRRPVGLEKAAALLEISLTRAQLVHLEDELAMELASVRPFADVVPALRALRENGFKIGLCSNLGQDYAAPVLAQLPFELDAYAWSFEAGAIKPEPAIYAHACRQLACVPGNVLMVGDTRKADVDGPRAFGMQALLLDRKQCGSSVESISGLSALCATLQGLK